LHRRVYVTVGAYITLLKSKNQMTLIRKGIPVTIAPLLIQ